MLLFASGLFSLKAQVKITGIISDQNKSPLANATIREKGTKNGVSADPAGAFSINVKQGAKLQISAVGYETKEVTWLLL